jgi:hypothetical protein
MISNDDDDVSYLDIKPEHVVQIPPQEKVWAQIGDDLKLAHIDWDIITAMANQFDENHRQGKPKTQSEVMSKLLVLVRDETRKECGAKGI